MLPLRFAAPVLVALVAGCPHPPPARPDAARTSTPAPSPVAAVDTPRAALERAREALAMGREPATALDDARLAAAGLPEVAEAHRILGQLLEESGDVTGAKTAYLKAISLEPEPALRRKVASLEARHGAPELAILAWETLRDETPDDLSAQLELAELYEKVDRPASAEAAYREALRLAPASVPLQRRVAAFLERQGKLREARALRRQADDASSGGPRRLRELPKSRR